MWTIRIVDGLTYSFDFSERGDFVELFCESGYPMKRFVDLDIIFVYLGKVSKYNSKVF